MGRWDAVVLGRAALPRARQSLPARAISRYFLDEGTTTCTHVADQHSTYGTKAIPSTMREATYVLDEILGNPTDLPIAEHAVDTHGQTSAAFAAFDLRLSPRIRDLASLQLSRLCPAAEVAAYPHTGPLLTRRLHTELIESQWEELLRLAGSLKFGHATASLLIAKLQAGERQNALTRALLEYGRFVLNDLRPALPRRRGAAATGQHGQLVSAVKTRRTGRSARGAHRAIIGGQGRQVPLVIVNVVCLSRPVHREESLTGGVSPHPDAQGTPPRLVVVSPSLRSLLPRCEAGGAQIE